MHNEWEAAHIYTLFDTHSQIYSSKSKSVIIYGNWKETREPIWNLLVATSLLTWQADGAWSIT